MPSVIRPALLTSVDRTTGDVKNRRVAYGKVLPAVDDQRTGIARPSEPLSRIQPATDARMKPDVARSYAWPRRMTVGAAIL